MGFGIALVVIGVLMVVLSFSTLEAKPWITRGIGLGAMVIGVVLVFVEGGQ